MRGMVASPEILAGTFKVTPPRGGYPPSLGSLEDSGHYHQNWTDPGRTQFQNFWRNLGFDVRHTPGPP